MTYFAKTILTAGAIAISVGCSGASQSTQTDAVDTAPVAKAEKSSHQGYKKPSAAINFSNNFGGQSTVGVIENVTFEMTDRYPGGTVELDIVPSDGVQLFGNNLKGASYSLDGDTVNNLDLQFQANRDGIHNITILAKVTMADGQFITRSYAMPIYVGEDFQPTKRTGKTPETAEIGGKKVSGGLVIMEAEETIED